MEAKSVLLVAVAIWCTEAFAQEATDSVANDRPYTPTEVGTGLTIENSLVTLAWNSYTNTSVSASSPTTQRWLYQLSSEISIAQQILVRTAYIAPLGKQTSAFKIGGGFRFTPPWAARDTQQHNRYASSVVVSYLVFEVRNEAFNGIEIRVERRQQKIGKIIVLDVGAAILPWTKQIRDGHTMSRAFYLAYTVGIGIEADKRVTFMFETDRYTPIARKDEQLSFSAFRLTFRSHF
jgi:hypothetical protein